jgi:hypothetical protein
MESYPGVSDTPSTRSRGFHRPRGSGVASLCLSDFVGVVSAVVVRGNEAYSGRGRGELATTEPGDEVSTVDEWKSNIRLLVKCISVV